MDDSDIQIDDGHPDSKSIGDDMPTGTGPQQPNRSFSGVGVMDEMPNYLSSKPGTQIDSGKQIDDGRKVNDSVVQIYEGHKPLPDPSSPVLVLRSATDTETHSEPDLESSPPIFPPRFPARYPPEYPVLEFSSDSDTEPKQEISSDDSDPGFDPERPYELRSRKGILRFSTLKEMHDYMDRKDSYESSINGNSNIDGDKQMEGGIQTDGGLRSDVRINDGDISISDPESSPRRFPARYKPEYPVLVISSDSDPEPEQEISSDDSDPGIDPERPFVLRSKEGILRFSKLEELFDYRERRDNYESLSSDNSKQMAIDEGASQPSSTKSRERKRKGTAPCCTCLESPAKIPKTENPPLSEGYEKPKPQLDAPKMADRVKICHESITQSSHRTHLL